MNSWGNEFAEKQFKEKKEAIGKLNYLWPNQLNKLVYMKQITGKQVCVLYKVTES